MRLCRLHAITLRHLYLIRGSFARLLPLFIWVAVDMVLWGFLTRYLNQVARSGINFVPMLLGAVLLWDFFIRVMQGVTMSFFEDVWSRNFLNVFATPILVSEYVGGMVLTSILTSLVGLVIMLVLATIVFDLSFFAFGLALIPFLMVLFLFGIALGVLSIALVLRLGPAAEWFIWPLPAIVSPFAGVLYPIGMLPDWMQWISWLLPPSYVFEAMRGMIAGGGVPYWALAWGVALVIVYVAGACWIFNRTYKHAIRTGLIARYSAETVG